MKKPKLSRDHCGELDAALAIGFIKMMMMMMILMMMIITIRHHCGELDTALAMIIFC